ncbi:MAG TPA: cyclase family protein [candidate division Zixibacteria bacterium]|jgi:arylformamidase
MPQIIDISQKLETGIAVWPGDTAFETFWVMQMGKGDACNVGSVTMSLHTGTHADAPLHFLSDGGSPVDADLTPYIGDVYVLDCAGVRELDRRAIGKLGQRTVKRVLFKTGTASATRFGDDFASFTAEAARLLMDRGVILVGIDTPSVDRADSKTLDAHKVFASAGAAILENLSLGHVAEGHYELIALPLKLAGMDASPVRAILRRR